MHQHVTCFTAWRYRRGMPGAEATLRRIADEQIVLVSTGGGDFTHPAGEAVAVDGGYRVTGRKRFVSQSAGGTVMATMFPFDDPERGMRVLNMAVPLGAEGRLGRRQLGRARHARHGQRRRRARRTSSFRRSGCSPTALTA